MRDIIFIIVAGGLGAGARYYLAEMARRLLGAGFPYGTLTVNIIGSFLIGLVMQISITTEVIPRDLRVALTIGFLGAFTTFSTFSYETLGYFENGSWLLGGLNVLANVVICLLAAFLGLVVGRAILGSA